MTRAEELDHGCLSKVADDEPIFVLRAKDVLAISTVYTWILRARSASVSEEKLKKAKNLIHKMRDWQEKNGCKYPD